MTLIIARIIDVMADQYTGGLVHLFSIDWQIRSPLCRIHVSERVGLRVVRWLREPLTCLWCAALLVTRQHAA